MKIASAHVHSYSLPFKKPITTARGRFIYRRGLLLELRDHYGHIGWGDAAPWPGFSSSNETNLREAFFNLISSQGVLIDRSFNDLQQIITWLSQKRITSLPSEAVYAVELALLDLLGQERGQSIAELLGASPETRVPISAVASDLQEAEENIAAGIKTIKVKVGYSDLSRDEERLFSIRQAVGSSIHLRADANGAWSLQTARKAIERFRRFDLQWLEQPVAARCVDDLKSLRGRGIPIAVDEAISVSNITGVLPSADVYVLKPMFLGGLLASKGIAEHTQKKLAISCAWESGIGRLGALHLAAAIAPRCAAGLSSPLLYDVTPPSTFECLEGGLSIPDRPGLGVTPEHLMLRDDLSEVP